MTPVSTKPYRLPDTKKLLGILWKWPWIGEKGGSYFELRLGSHGEELSRIDPDYQIQLTVVAVVRENLDGKKEVGVSIPTSGFTTLDPRLITRAAAAIKELEDAAREPEYEVHGNYGYGWDRVTGSEGKEDCQQLLRDYRFNEPRYSFKMVKVPGLLPHEVEPA